MKEARAKGVILDSGGGAGQWSWRVAEAAAVEGIWPDTISTDDTLVTIRGIR